MMNSHSRPTTNTTNSSKPLLPPAIPFDRPEIKDYAKNEVLSLKLRSNPMDNESQTYELTVPFFHSGTAEEWLTTKRAIKKIVTGQNITAGPAQYAMT